MPPIDTPDGWQGGQLEDLLRDFQEMKGDDTLLRMLEHIGATPEQAATIPIESHVLATSAPAKAMPTFYEAKARSSDIPLQTALSAYNAGLQLMDEENLLTDPEFHKADALPMDAQVAIAVLLYAITDATMLQKQAVSGLTPEDYTALLGIPGMIAAGELDPTDGSEQADEEFAHAYGLLSQVDRSLIDQGALIMVHAVSHALPTLRDWGERERHAYNNPDERLLEIGELLDQYTEDRIEQMDPIERLDILADTLRMAAGFQGFDVPAYLQPLPPPSGERPLRQALEGLVKTVGAAGIDAGALEREFLRADFLPYSMQEAVARIVVNQEAVMGAKQGLNEVVVGVGDKVANFDVKDLSDPEEMPGLSADEQDALLAAVEELRHAEIRVVRAVQKSAPVLEAWGLFWAHHGQQNLPATPAHAPGKLGAVSGLGEQIADPEAGLEEVLRLSGQLKGVDTASHGAPPLPPQGALVDAVLGVYAHYGIPVDDSLRDRVQQGVDELPEVVERNAARILLAQVDAMVELKELEDSMSVEDRRVLSQGPLVLERLLGGAALSVSDVQTLRAYYEVVDRVEGTYLDQATRLGAAIDASADALGEYSDAVLEGSGSSGETVSGKSGSLLSGVWSFVQGFQLIRSVSAQSGPGEPYHLPPVCPVASPLADCDNDVWFMDPILETVVIAGFEPTEFDPRLMGSGRDRSGSGGDDLGSFADSGQGGQVLTVALGGDNIYRNNAGGASPDPVRVGTDDVSSSTTIPMVAVALDMNGDDRYLPAPPGFSFDAVQGAAITGIGVLYDRRGDDRYEASGMAQGFAALGVGVLFDGDGDDRYVAEDFAQGSSFGLGLGLLVDRAGDDRYSLTGGNAKVPAVGQGGAMGLSGMGVLVDAAGDDEYLGGMQGRGTDGGIGILVDLDGDDSYSRAPPAEANEDDGQEWDWNGRCWTSLRAPSSSAFDPTTRAANDNVNLSQGFDGDDPERFAGEATANAASLAAAASGDTQRLVGALASGTGVFVDVGEEGCAVDLQSLLPGLDVDPGIDPGIDPGDDLDPGELEDAVMSAVDNLMDPSDDMIFDIPGVIALGDAGNVTYEQEYEVVLDLGGHNTFFNRSSAARLLVAFDTAGDDQYLASGEDCVQGCNAILIDMGGNDTFVANNLAQGVTKISGGNAIDILDEGVYRAGVLFNADGDDTYVIEEVDDGGMGQGGADVVSNNQFGIGVFLDVAGDDRYESPSQGVARGESRNLVAAFFLDLSGNDTYSPVGDQGLVRQSASTTLLAAPLGVGFAAFVDGGGDDRYVGALDNWDLPDWSDQYNGRAVTRFSTIGVKSSPVVDSSATSLGLFWDVDRSELGDSLVPLIEGGMQGGAFELGPLGIKVGTSANEVYEDDYVLLINPGGDNRYHNNAGGTLLRVDSEVTQNDNLADGSEVEGEVTYDPARNHPLASILIDLDGSDYYGPKDPLAPYVDSHLPALPSGGILTQGAGFLGTGILVDDSGNVAAGLLGAEASGGADDIYVAHAMSQGFGLYGWGILWDKAGDDTYRYDPAVVMRPALDGNLAAWLQYRGRSQDLAGNQLSLAGEARDALGTVQDVTGNQQDTQGLIARASAGTWAVHVRGGGEEWAENCRVNIDNQRGPFHGVTVSGTDNGLLVSAFNHEMSLWHLFQVQDLGDPCSSRGGTINPEASRVASGSNNPIGNQINPQFATLRDNDVLWQDDRDGTWSLYHKAVDSLAGDCSRPLQSWFCDPEEGDLLGSHDPSTSNQTNPHTIGPRVVYQDDRHAGDECPDGTWSIHLYNFNARDEEQRLSGECGVHVKPRISTNFVVWQTRGVDPETGEPVGPWNLSVYRLTGSPPEPDGGRERLVELPGDQYDPVAVGQTILYTSITPDGEHSVNQYFWNRDADLDEHRVERFAAVQPALNPENRFQAVWVDTNGREDGVVGSGYWEIFRKDLGTEAFPGREGTLWSYAAGTSQWLQGASYAYGRGILFNEGGANTYVGDRFTQGAAASLTAPKDDFRFDRNVEWNYIDEEGGEIDAFGALVDADGNDVYSARGESQGVHFAREVVAFIGVPDPGGQPLAEVLPIFKADATYSIGLLLDMRGNDRYEANRNAQGYGALTLGGGATSNCGENELCNPVRLFIGPSHGLFMDLGGFDSYQYPQSLNQRVPVDPDFCGMAEGLLGPAGDIVEPLVGLCYELVSPGGDGSPTGAVQEGDRNNEIWRQGPRGGISMGGLTDGTSPNPVTIGGIGMDLPLMDNLENALRDFADEQIDLTPRVEPVAGAGGVDSERFWGVLEFAVEASFNGDDLNLEFDRTEFFVGRLLGGVRAVDAETTGDTWTFRLPWDTESGGFPDGEYELLVRTHYSHPAIGPTLGYAEERKTFDVDNVPSILHSDVSVLEFSPFPFGESAPGHPTITYQISPDHPENVGARDPEHDGWVRVEVLNDEEEQVVVLSDTTTQSGETPSVIWDGTNETNEVVPPGRYVIRINATDRDPEGWAGADRVRSELLPVFVFSDTPRDACVLDASSGECTAGGWVTRASSSRIPSADDSVRSVRLNLGATTSSGAEVSRGLEAIRLFHVYLGEPGTDDEDEINWNATPNTRLPSDFTMDIEHGAVKHVMVIVEDEAGNLECIPACGGARTNESVKRGHPDSLGQAFENKRELAESLHSETSPVYATFQADFNPPIRRAVHLFVDDEPTATSTVPRVGPNTNITIVYEVFEDIGAPIPELDWLSRENVTFRAEHTDEDPAVSITALDDDATQGGDYEVTWDGWSDLVADWPQGLVRVTLGARDKAGNVADSPRTLQFLLDKTEPEVRDVRVAYPGGQMHAEEGDVVTLLVDAADPDLGIFTTNPRHLRLGIDASNVTVETATDDPDDPGNRCTLRFDPAWCFTPGGRWKVDIPINTTGMDIDWENLVAKPFNVTLNVTDVAGNTLQETVPIVLGSPMLGPQPVDQEVGIYNATITWSTDKPAMTYLMYGEGTTADDLRHRVDTTASEPNKLHGFELTDLDPGTNYVYRFFAVDPETGAEQAGSADPIGFATLHGVDMRLSVPDPDALHRDPLSGVERVEGTAWVQSARDDDNLTIEPRVVMRLFGPGIPMDGRPIFDSQTEDDAFGMDFVTDALEDGVYSMQVTVSYLGEEVTTTVEGLLVDNTPPGLRFVEPADGSVLSQSPERVRVRVTEELTPIQDARLQFNGNGTSAMATFHPDGDAHDGIIEFTHLPPLSPGIQRVDVFADDQAGNPGHARIEFLYDPDAPEASAKVVYPEDQQAARPGQWVTVRVGELVDLSGVERVVANTTGLGGSSDVAFVRDGRDHVLELQVPGDQSEGEHPVAVQVHDTAGNVRALTAVVVVDATPPGELALALTPLGSSSALAEVNASQPVTVVLDVTAPGVEALRVVRDELAAPHVLHLEGLQAGTEYEIALRVVDRAGHEATMDKTWTFLPELGDAPPVTNLTATASGPQVDLEWDDAGDGFRYALHRAQADSFETVAVATTPAHRDYDVSPGSSYRYFVQALDPRGSYGEPSEIVTVDVPVAKEEKERAQVSVNPQTGIAGQTEFVFTVRLDGMQEENLAVWLVLDNKSLRMSKEAGADCRQECTFRYSTTLSAIDLGAPSMDYYVEVFTGSGAIRLPESGSLEGPEVLVRDETANGALKEASALSIIILMVALIGAVLFARRRDPL